MNSQNRSFTKESMVVEAEAEMKTSRSQIRIDFTSSLQLVLASFYHQLLSIFINQNRLKSLLDVNSFIQFIHKSKNKLSQHSASEIVRAKLYELRQSE